MTQPLFLVHTQGLRNDDDIAKTIGTLIAASTRDCRVRSDFPKDRVVNLKFAMAPVFDTDSDKFTGVSVKLTISSKIPGQLPIAYQTVFEGDDP